MGEDRARRYALQDFFGAADVQGLVAYIPHCVRLGMEVLEVGPCRARLRLPYRAELVGDPVRRVVFGGTITTLLDNAAGIAVSCSLEQLTTIATLDLRIDYLRAAAPDRDLIGEAVCYKLTRNVAFVRATAWEERLDDPFATSLATFMLGSSSAETSMARALREKGA
jgi:uncharacterized protein (TIGR00369 family)